MADFLKQIETNKRKEIALAKQKEPLLKVKARAKGATPIRNFHQALSDRIATGEFALISEIKKASPSKGVIRETFNPTELARQMKNGGADCLSVLTDSTGFQGSPIHLGSARLAAGLPTLCKDFMLDPYQVYQSRLWNADCILIIMALVSDDAAKEIEEAALELNMSALLEVHDEAELERALRLDSRLIGINNRDLDTFEVSLKTCETLAPQIPDDRLIVGESGISTHQDMVQLFKSGISAFLVGESLMRAENVEQATRTLLNRPSPGPSPGSGPKR